MQEKKILKTKHNKKRNTAFLYEIIVREITKNILENNDKNKNFLVSLCRQYFSNGKTLKKELDIYFAINESYELDKETAQNLLREAKYQYDLLDKNKIFAEQTKLINVLNKFSNGTIFSTFVPDYKNLATLSQIFNNTISIKEKVLLEANFINKMISSRENNDKEKLQTLDNLTYKLFVKKFNEQYGTSLLNEQKDLITKYVMSFADSGIEFKLFLNEEIERIKQILKYSLQNKEITNDSGMIKKTNIVLEKVNKYKQKQIDQQMISEILKIQSLLKEISSEETSANG